MATPTTPPTCAHCHKIRTNNKLAFTDSKGTTHTTSLLSRTHDMACYSWSIPAGDTCPMAVYGEGFICDGCYAMINRYGMDPVGDAQWLRYIWTRHLLKHNPQFWIDTMVLNMVKLCTKGKNAVPYFRWHDSGDMFHISYILAIIEVCKSTPQIEHWIPTRGWQTKGIPIAVGSNWHKALMELASLPNVVVRSSALKFNQASPDTPYGPGSSAYDDRATVTDGMVVLDDVAHHACPKSTTDGGTCATCDCRRCWQSDGGDVAYYVHGWQGRHKAGKLSDTGKQKRKARKQRFTELSISAVA